MTPEQIVDLSRKCNVPLTQFLDTLHRQDPKCLYYKFLNLLCKAIKPKVVVELGVCTGRCTAHLADGAATGVVYAIDPSPWDLSKIAERHRNIIQCRQPSEDNDILKRLRRQEFKIDLLLIDTLHNFRQASLEYSLYKPHMALDGIICYDDIDLSDDMKRFWHWLPETTKISLPHLHQNYGDITPGFGVSL